ncbi:MAG: PTS sugar transporter subunit IIB [Erysipelotrichaceae bacterium]|jgi:D-glucosaminate-specific PTS system IIB component
MSEICLIRVDQRMIHGQVCLKWANVSKADKIVCVDDETSTNELVKSIFRLAAPAGVKVLVYSVEEFVKRWNNRKPAKDNVMIVFKDIETCYRTFKAGISMNMIQLGNIPSVAETVKRLGNEVAVTQKELDYLTEMSESGIRIEIQTIPEQTVTQFK